MTCQERARRRGVSRSDTLPWPPISRTRGVILEDFCVWLSGRGLLEWSR